LPDNGKNNSKTTTADTIYMSIRPRAKALRFRGAMIRRAEALRCLRDAEATARADTGILASTPASKLAGDPVSSPE